MLFFDSFAPDEVGALGEKSKTKQLLLLLVQVQWPNTLRQYGIPLCYY